MNKNELANKIRGIDGLTNDEKSALIELLRKQKKYGLVWEDKPENVEERLREELPVLIEDTSKAIISEDADAPNHILIEGDNLEALTALAYTHEGKIDVIYIDPPYNTGKKDEFKYNDKYVDVLNERFNGKVAADIFDAVKKDVDAGVMQEYNLQRMLDGVDKDTSYMYNLMLNFTVPKGNRVGKSWNVDGFTWYEELLDILGVTKEYSDFGDARSDGIETYSVNIRFGENCTNLIAVLKENGLISSKEPLLTYE